MVHFHFHVARKTRLRAVIAISFAFFAAEISVGFYTHSLALVADAFHYLNDLIGFIIALIAVQVTERKTSPQDLTFGWVRAQLLGAFFNGAFLIALGLSIFLQSIERFVDLKEVENPKLVLIIGCVGLGLNIISAIFLHEHDHGDGGHGHGHGHGHEHEHSHSHSHADDEATAHALQTPNWFGRHTSHKHLNTTVAPKGMDLGMVGVLVHVLGDAINNIGVIIAALIIWLTHGANRFYADPAVSLWIAIMILFSALPLTKRSGNILLQSAPPGVNLDDVKKDLESIPGVKDVHELHVWRLDQAKAIASAHVIVEEVHLARFMEIGKVISECLHAYGVHSATLQPELAPHESGGDNQTAGSVVVSGLNSPAGPGIAKCALTCGTLCEPLTCCK